MSIRGGDFMNPISRIIYLWKNKKIREKKMSLMIYICLYIILLVDFFYGYFFYFESKTMFIVDMVCLAINIFVYVLYELNKKKEGIMLLISELFVFLILGTLLTGWNYGFQQYIYGMICVIFLPFYVPDDFKVNKHIIFAFGFSFIITYYVLDYICNYTSLVTGIESTILTAKTIYAVNSMISICAVSAFCGIATKLSTEDKKKLRRKADYDELTKIYNRYGLHELLEELKNDKKSTNIAIIDIDFFKKVNDNYGHNVGDYVLKIIASKLKELTSHSISVGRWGGEEFLVIADPSMNKGEFRNYLEELRLYFEKKYLKVDNKRIKITVSGGIGKFNPRASIESNIKGADDNLYKAKETGRNKIVG